MKKLFILFLSFFVMNMNAESHVVEDTGFYGVYVKSVPFWRFWNQFKALGVIKKVSGWQESTSDIIFYWIHNHLPILCTWNYEEAENLKNELVVLGCEVEIREMRFVCENEEEVTKLRNQLFLNQLKQELNLTDEELSLLIQIGQELSTFDLAQREVFFKTINKLNVELAEREVIVEKAID